MFNKSLLVVDDQAENLAVLRQLLSPHYKLYFATNGEEALRTAEKRKPSLILLDVQMPGMDGYQVCEKLKAHPDLKNTPVIFVTGLDNSVDETHGFDLGAVDYIAKPFSPAIVLARVKTHLSLVQATELNNSYIEAVHMLGEAGHFNDTDTGMHIWRMASYCKAIAQARGWDSEACEILNYSSAMHDTGKIAIPSQILRKPGKLNAAEWEIMKTHTTLGKSILEKSHSQLFECAAEISLHHHERFDGSGYPDGLGSQDISEQCRIVALCDVFDALVSKRPYKEPWSIEDALREIQNISGTHLDPEIVETFMDNLDNIFALKDKWDSKEAITTLSKIAS